MSSDLVSYVQVFPPSNASWNAPKPVNVHSFLPVHLLCYLHSTPPLLHLVIGITSSPFPDSLVLFTSPPLLPLITDTCWPHLVFSLAVFILSYKHHKDQDLCCFNHRIPSIQPLAWQKISTQIHNLWIHSLMNLGNCSSKIPKDRNSSFSHVCFLYGPLHMKPLRAISLC